MGYAARRRHRFEFLATSARELVAQRLDERVAQQPLVPVTGAELCAFAAEGTDQFKASADGDLPLTTDDVMVIVETLLRGVVASRIFAIDAIAMVERINVRI